MPIVFHVNLKCAFPTSPMKESKNISDMEAVSTMFSCIQSVVPKFCFL